MSEILNNFNFYLNKLNEIVWGIPMLILLVGMGIFLSIRLKFFQIIKFKLIIKETLMKIIKNILKPDKRKRGEGGITPFQALSTALAGTIGVGNIAGVATAIFIGGPGAVFWMWVSAFFGMMTKYSEVVLAVKYREKNKNGEYIGGPMLYIKKGLNSKFLANVFAFCAVLASFGMGNMTQANSISAALKTGFNIPQEVTGVIVALLVGIVIIGGIKRVASVTEKIVPFMSIFYILGAVIVIAANYQEIPKSFSLIFGEAFKFKAVSGGILGSVMIKAMYAGIARGVFSNEAGLGSSSIAHAAAITDHPARQGLWGAFEVFLDTLVVCTITALAIITTGVWRSGELNGVDLSVSAFYSVLGDYGVWFLALSILLFAFATIIGWSYYGEKCIEFLFSEKMLTPYKFIFVIFVFIGSVLELNTVWKISDTFNGLMAIPNLIALLFLSGIVVKTTKDAFNIHILK